MVKSEVNNHRPNIDRISITTMASMAMTIADGINGGDDLSSLLDT